jgi:membrane protein required for colicin V production
MTSFDYAILAILALSVLISIWRGLVREVISILSWLVALWLAVRFAVDMAEWMPAAISNPSLRYVAAFACLFLGTIIVLELIGVLIAKLLRAVGLGFLDRLLGAIFGFARGALIAWGAGPARRVHVPACARLVARLGPGAAAADGGAGGAAVAPAGTRQANQVLVALQHQEPACAESSASSPTHRSTRSCMTG